MVDVESFLYDIRIQQKFFAKKSETSIIHWYWVLKMGLRLTEYDMSSEAHRFTFSTYPVKNMKAC
jgi:hypothetical protein